MEMTPTAVAQRRAVEGPIVCHSVETLRSYLERQPRLDMRAQHLRHRSIEIGEDLHRKLRGDVAIGDQVVQSIGEGHSDAGPAVELVVGLTVHRCGQRRRMDYKGGSDNQERDICAEEAREGVAVGDV